MKLETHLKGIDIKMKLQTTIKILSIVAFVLLEPSYGSKTDISLCTNIKNDKNRLACFDKITKQDKNNQALPQRNKPISSPKKGLKKNDRIDKLVNTKSSIVEVYSNILFTHVLKDKFETSNEYKERLDNPKFNTYAVIEQLAEKEYNADKKLYKICFDGPNSYDVGFGYQYFRGDENTKSIGISDPIKPKQSDIEIDFNYSASKSAQNMDKNFGRKAKSITYTIHPDNFKSIIKKKKLSTTTVKQKIYGFIKNTTCITIHADKEKAKKVDKYDYMIKIGVTLKNIRTHMYRDSWFRDSHSSGRRSLGFNGHINEFAIYNKDTKEILFSYTD